MSKLTADQVTRLREAGRIVQGVVDELDTSKSLCDCCGLARYNDWDHKQAAQELGAIVRKLARPGLIIQPNDGGPHASS